MGITWLFFRGEGIRRMSITFAFVISSSPLKQLTSNCGFYLGPLFSSKAASLFISNLISSVPIDSRKLREEI